MRMALGRAESPHSDRFFRPITVFGLRGIVIGRLESITVGRFGRPNAIRIVIGATITMRSLRSLFGMKGDLILG